MVVGAAGELPKPPAEPIKFLEDMNDTELADAVGSMPMIRLSVLIRPSSGCPLVSQSTRQHNLASRVI
jgi:hypothetical protein